ncbi:hypothetical protein SAMN05421869_107323 [Nonomuraea jiangxiensis]|uniref:Uncharacterized protein n=2 Tax=Nonomuraea jiangxiensis TaxID=633440 RepID=A0A1G8P4B2_9ACTN|nr:hypothetical protein SAMN05421869_107323 [Nonomuraea jiangxiensis]
MFRALAILAATAPLLLSILTLESCGYFAYQVMEPSALETAVWQSAGYASTLLPLILAFLALWAPRQFPKVGAICAAVTLALNALTLVIPYTSPCGQRSGEWLVVACHAVAVVALLRTRPGHQLPRPRAALWSAVVLLVLGQALARRYFSDVFVGCWADLRGSWAQTAIHLDTAGALYIWVGLAAVGAVLAAHPSAPLVGLALLVPGLFHPVAWFLSSAPHGCSSTLDLFGWPHVIAGALALLSHARLPGRGGPGTTPEREPAQPHSS